MANRLSPRFGRTRPNERASRRKVFGDSKGAFFKKPLLRVSFWRFFFHSFFFAPPTCKEKAAKRACNLPGCKKASLPEGAHLTANTANTPKTSATPLLYRRTAKYKEYTRRLFQQAFSAAFSFGQVGTKEKAKQKENALSGALPLSPPPFEKGGRKLFIGWCVRLGERTQGAARVY